VSGRRRRVGASAALPRRLPDGPAARAEAIRILRAGGIVALPTDTVYGIAVALETRGGIEALFAAKGRPPDRAIALLVADLAQAADIGELDAPGRALAEAFWPGGLTLVVRRRTDRQLPAALIGGSVAPGAIESVGLRLPDHAAPRALAAALGPLPTTSANRSGEPEARDAGEIAALLGPAIALIIDGGPMTGGPASTVVDVTGPEPRILRAGAVSREAIARVLGSSATSGMGR
jgi:L-threonylcarbamoyladenylate synthase